MIFFGHYVCFGNVYYILSLIEGVDRRFVFLCEYKKEKISDCTAGAIFSFSLFLFCMTQLCTSGGAER